MPKNLGQYDNDLSVPRKKDLDALETRIKTNEDDIAMAQSDIEGLSGDVGALKTDVNQVKTALGSKQDTVVGGASTVVENNLTANRTLISNASGKVAVGGITVAELNELHGISSNIQQQFTASTNRMSGLTPISSIVATRWSKTVAYHKGDVVYYSANTLMNAFPYRANEDIPAGAWDATKWTKIVVVDELDKKYSADNPPPYPVTSVNTKTGEVALTASDVGALPVTGGTMSGVLSAQSNTSYTTAQARNIIMSTELPSGGQPGEIWIRYSD